MPPFSASRHRKRAVAAADRKPDGLNSKSTRRIFSKAGPPGGALPRKAAPGLLGGQPGERGVTHIDALSEAISARRPDQLAYFAFDLLHLDGRDLRRCPIEDRKALLRDVIGASKCPRIVHVDYVFGIGRELFEAVRQLAAKGIVSKRRGSPYYGGESRDWVKVKVFDIGQFVITGFTVQGPGRLEEVFIAEERDGQLVPTGQVKFGLGHTRRAAHPQGGLTRCIPS